MKKVKILIVEDEKIVAINLKESLESLGYAISGIVSTGKAVIQKVKESKPDLILMDIMLEGDMDGIQAADKIRSFLDVPIIYLTAYSDETTLERAKITEPFGYIVKPFNQRELRITIDIALYKYKMENRLKISEERYRTLIGNLPVGIFRATPDWKLLSVNPVLVKMFGYNSQEEMLELSNWEIFSEPQHQQVLIRKLNTDNSVTNFEGIIQYKDGSTKWVLLNVKAVLDDKENIIHFDGIAEDINERKQIEDELVRYRDHLEEMIEKRTAALIKANEDLGRGIIERKRVEVALRESEERYRTLVETLQEGLGIVDPDENIIFANPAFCNIFGYSRKEIIGMNLRSLVPKEEVQKILRETSKREKGIVSQYDLIMMRKDRELINTRISAVPYKNRKDKFQGTIGLVLNITEQKRAEAALRDSEERFRTIAEKSADGIFALDMKGRITYVSPAIKWIAGYSPKEILGKYFFEYIVNIDITRASRALNQLGTGKILENLQLKLKKKDNSSAIVEINASADFKNGKKIGTHGIIRDITERSKAQNEKEKLLKQLAEAEKLATLGQFTAGIAHEINNPLHIILGKLFLLQSSLLEDNQTPELERHITKIEQQVYRIKHLTQDVLNYVKPHAIILKPIEINSLVLQVVDSLSEYFADVLGIETHLDSNLPLVQGDAIGLEIVTKNLILNAIESIQQTGKITICTRILKREVVEISITDTGKGIPEKDLSTIFEPFFTTKQKSGGTGLGLAICKEIIEQHEGIISVKSKLNEGTTFTIHLSSM